MPEHPRSSSPARRYAALVAFVTVSGIAVAVFLSARGSQPAAANPMMGVVAVVGGEGHTCAIVQGGAVNCWGWNRSGQVGDATMTDRPFPVAVPGISEATVLAAGAAHSCVYIPGTGVRCWGLNAWGQLGLGTDEQCSGLFCSTVPVTVAGLNDDIAAIGAGVMHTCALTTGGAVKCWGRNQYGQLGNGTNVNSGSPVNVTGLGSGVTALTVGGFHACARLADDELRCWGNNASGQLGDGTTTNSSVPVSVSGLPGPVESMSAGYMYMCVVEMSGGAMCWGENFAGQLGDGTNMQRHQPVGVSGLDGVVAAISAAESHTCALLDGGGVKCWGNNEFGRLGDGELLRRPTPDDVVGLQSGVSAVWRGSVHTCASVQGVLKCWGDNSFGQLGGETTEFCTFTGELCALVPIDVVLSPKATPTPPTTATPTPTATPTVRAGDVDCDGAVTSIDAALVLQLGAGLIDGLPCADGGDVNDDGHVDAIDAALILQHVAGLLDSLPV
jgi:alpha-tubulin suppressor-like RCC1 family protein